MRWYYRLKNISWPKDEIVFRLSSKTKNKYTSCRLENIHKVIQHAKSCRFVVHEVIASEKQRFYMDLDDIPKEPIDTLASLWGPDVDMTVSEPGNNLYLLSVLESITFGVEQEYGLTLSPSDFTILYNDYGDRYSYHIIVHGCVLPTRRDAKYLAGLLPLDVDVLPYIDPLYKRNQSFRIEASRNMKGGTNRRVPRVFWPDIGWVEQDCAIDYSTSLVTAVHGVSALLSRVPEDVEEITYDEAPLIGIINKHASKHGITLDNFDMEMDGQILRLKRNAPSFCETCQQVHENENAKVYSLNGAVYFECFRAFKYNPANRRVLLTVSNPVEIDYLSLLDNVPTEAKPKVKPQKKVNLWNRKMMRNTAQLDVA